MWINKITQSTPQLSLVTLCFSFSPMHRKNTWNHVIYGVWAPTRITDIIIIFVLNSWCFDFNFSLFVFFWRILPWDLILLTGYLLFFFGGLLFRYSTNHFLRNSHGRWTSILATDFEALFLSESCDFTNSGQRNMSAFQLLILSSFRNRKLYPHRKRKEISIVVRFDMSLYW